MFDTVSDSHVPVLALSSQHQSVSAPVRVLRTLFGTPDAIAIETQLCFQALQGYDNSRAIQCPSTIPILHAV